MPLATPRPLIGMRETKVILESSPGLWSPFGNCYRLSTPALCSDLMLTALVVDDSMLIRHIVCRFLEERGFAVESASNGRDALQVLGRIRPTLIITDMQMPVMGGSELITAIKACSETATIPIVIVAGRSSGFDENEKRAQFVIFKDIDIDQQLEKALAATVGPQAAKHNTAAK